jgi:hypothetical protein
MINLVLQHDEAEAVERLIDSVLINERLSETLFKDGVDRRSAKRASKKIFWARKAE